MAMVINSNIQSLNAQRHLNNSLSAQNTATERLSSGLRINSAADDAAGLAIANRMTSQVKGLNMAIRNANDGVSMIQTAEGALSETTNILQRMRELSIQSANGIYDSGNRGTLNAEVQQLKAEIDRIAETTSFNGLKILDGSTGDIDLQVGDAANQTITVSIQKMDSKTLGMGSTSIDVLGAPTNEASFTTTKTLENNDVLINGQSIMKIGESFDGAHATEGFMSDLLDKINTNVHGVTASTVSTATSTTIGDGVLETGTNLQVVVAGLSGASTTIQVTETENMQELVDKLNSEGGGLISASITDEGKLSISAENSASIAVTGSATATGTIAASVNASIALTSDNGDPITIERGTTGTLEDLSFLGFRESNVAGVIEGKEIIDAATTDAFKVGDLTINGVSVGKSDSEFLDDKIAAINAVSEESGVTATAFSTAAIEFDGVGKLTGGVIKLNGTDVTIANDTVEKAIEAINLLSKDTGVTATKLGTRMILEGDVSSITIGKGAATPLAAFGDGTNSPTFQTGFNEEAGTAGVTIVATDNISTGGIKLTSENGNPISVTHKDATAMAKTGLLDSNSAADGKFGAAVNSLDISTAAGAQKAINILDTAIQTISDVRGDLGAITNRLDHTMRNLSNVSENASAARSRIMDADFAAESANLSRAQVLQQAGNAMLAQANARPQQVLSLLQ